MKKSLLIGRVAGLAKGIENRTLRNKHVGQVSTDMFDIDENSKDVNGVGTDILSNAGTLEGIERSSEQNIKISELLGAWEEPELADTNEVGLFPGININAKSHCS
jgi:hypothetical protein